MSFPVFPLFLVLALSAACVKTPKQSGYVFDPRAIEALQESPSSLTKAEVLSRLGSPSSTSEYGDETWYYISTKAERVAFLRPKILERRVVAVVFQADGSVKEVKEMDANDAKNVQFAKDFTPTEGHDLGVMEQLFGNIGKFNGASNDRGGRLPGQH